MQRSVPTELFLHHLRRALARALDWRRGAQPRRPPAPLHPKLPVVGTKASSRATESTTDHHPARDHRARRALAHRRERHHAELPRALAHVRPQALAVARWWPRAYHF